MSKDKVVKNGNGGVDMNFYKSIIERSPTGYACHKIILDENNGPCDYEFIEVNIAFESLTGLKRIDILGKNITEVLPDIKKSAFNWIKFYGNIAINGNSEEFEQFFEPLKRWYKVTVYSPEKYYFITHFIDITKEKSQLDELNSFFDVNLDLLCIADLEGNFIKTNKSWEKTLGCSTADLNKRMFLDFVHPDDIADTLEVMKNLAEQREVLNFVNRYLCKDGSYHWIEWRSYPKGKLIYAAARDITERVNASRDISFQATLLKQVHNGIIVVDLNNTIIYWNKFAEELYQWKSDEVIGKNIIDLLSPVEMKETVYENFKDLSQDGHWEGEFNVQKKDGCLIPVHITNTYLKDLEGNNIGLIGISRDITERKQTEAALNQAEESKRVLLDNIQTQVWYLTNEYTYGAVNQAHAAFNGVAIEDFAFKNMYDIFPADIVDVCRQSNHEVFTTGKTAHTKEWLPHVSGEKRLVSITKTSKLRLDGSVEYVVCSADDITAQELANDKVKNSEAHLNALVSNTPAVIYAYTIGIDQIPDLTYINKNVTSVLGFKPDDFVGNMALWASCVHPEDMPKLQEKLTGKEMLNEYRFKDKDGDYHWLLDQQQVYKKENGITKIIGTWWDITKRKEMERLLFNEKEQFKTTLLSVGDGIVSTDAKGNVVILSPIAERLTGWTQAEAVGRSIEEVFHIINEFTRERCDNPVTKILVTGDIIELANHILLISKDGFEIPIENSVAPIKDALGNITGVVLVFRDFTEKKKSLAKITYLSFHDHLTGLYNRRFFEAEVERLDTERNLPITIIMGDVNGLKLINDSFGHAAGDELLIRIARILKKSFRAADIIARVGGDEYAILLPKTDGIAAQKLINRTLESLLKEKVRDLDLSISFGLATKTDMSQTTDLVTKKAEDYMYNNKLFEGPSVRGRVIDSIVATINAKSPKEQAHSERVSELCVTIGEALKFEEGEIKTLKIFGLLHDIGKIAIVDDILNKADDLTDKEYNEIKRHSEIGFRILSTANDMSEIADYVLSHHERWDGKGYPKGLIGDSIPLPSRICAIADAYDAMTSDRSYRPAMTHEFAVEELQKNSGTQFDPKLVDAFLQKVLPKLSH